MIIAPKRLRPLCPRRDASHVWDGLLTAGRRVWGVAAADCHKYSMDHRDNLFNGYVQLPAVGNDGIIATLKKGRFYSTTGLAVQRIEWDQHGVYVAFGEEAEIQFIGAGGKELAAAAGREAR